MVFNFNLKGEACLEFEITILDRLFSVKSMNDIKLGMIQIDGLRELELRLLQLPEKLEKKILQESVRAGARVIQKEAKAIAPVSVAPHILKSYASAVFKKFDSSKMGVWILPGNLKKMIRVKIDNSKSRGYAITYEVYVKNKDAWYWKFQEFGTSKLPPHNGTGFMRPAFENMKLLAIAEINQQIRNRMESEGISG